MILGFAHLSVNVADLSLAEQDWIQRGYAATARFLDVPNPEPKQTLVHHHASHHSLSLLTTASGWPLELTVHGPLVGENQGLNWQPQAIQVRSRAIAADSKFFIEGLGFVGGPEGILSLTSRFQDWHCRLQLLDSPAPVIHYLDASGPSCLAFYVTRPLEDAQRLLDLGGTNCTESFSLKLGPRMLEIVMLRTPGGAIIELIKIVTRV